MRSKTVYLLLVLALVGLVLAGCGDDSISAGTDPGDDSVVKDDDKTDGDGSDNPATAVQGQWLLVEATIDGTVVTPVEGYPISIGFEGDRVSGNAGCNSFGGTFGFDGSTLALNDIAMTEMACVDPGPMEAETTFMAGLWRTTSVDRSDGRLVLAGDGVSLSFAPVAPVADAALVGTGWTLDTIIDGEAASSTINGADPALLELEDDGTFTASTGCRELSGQYTLDGDLLELSFGVDDFACEGPAGEQDPLVLAVLEQPTTVEIVENRLTITADDGTGLSYQVQPAG